MRRGRVLLGILTVGVVMVGAHSYLGRRLDGDQAVSPPVGPVAAVVPTPTPPPWHGSVLAAAVRDGTGQSVVLYEIGGNVLPRHFAGPFDEIGRLSWSPDGTRLAFGARRDTNWDLFLVARDGSAPQRLTTHPAYDDWPAWSPDGRNLAFSSNRDGNLDVYRLAVSGSGAMDVRRLTVSDEPAIEPAWSPDGASIAFAAWHEGSYGIDLVTSTGEGRRVVAGRPDGTDLRAPEWPLDANEIVVVAQRHGPGRLTALSMAATPPGDGEERRAPPPWRMASGVSAFGRYPEGGAWLTASDEREGRTVSVWDVAARDRQQVALLPPGSGDVSWTWGPMPLGLVEARLADDAATPTHTEDGGTAAMERLGLVRLTDVDVPGDRIHAGLADDFAKMRAEVLVAVGTDFLGTLSDLWRPLGFTGSSFFSWHKTGRAFDTQMELRGPGGRRDTVLVREDLRGRTYWRMYLRAAVQDGTVGEPLVEPGWAFTAGGGDPAYAAEGGRRGEGVPGGYWFDFTSIAERYGWKRIPSVTSGDLDWRSSWTGIDYWHYERRDGLLWFEAARQVYSDDEMDAELRAEQLRSNGVSFRRLSRLGFPADWLSEG